MRRNRCGKWRLIGLNNTPTTLPWSVLIKDFTGVLNDSKNKAKSSVPEPVRPTPFLEAVGDTAHGAAKNIRQRKVLCSINETHKRDPVMPDR